MIELGIYFLAAFGLSWVLAESKISFPLRKLLNETDTTISAWTLALLECVGCTGAHLGYTAVLLGVAPETFGHGLKALVFCALATVTSNLLIAKVLGLLEHD